MITLNRKDLFVVFGTAVVALIVAMVLNHPQTALGSVAFSNEYSATTTDSSYTAGVRTIKTGRGSLAQVTVTGANTGIVAFYDATTSDVSKRTGQKATSTITIAQFPASVAANTYTFDAQFNTGLLIVTSGVAPTTTITYR